MRMEENGECESPDQCEETEPKLQYGSQVMASLFACTSVVVGIGALGFSSPAIPRLQDAGLMTPNEASWFGSVFNIGGVFGGFCAGFWMDYAGRKGAVLTTAIPYSLGYFLLTLTDHVIIMCIGRAITGFGLGMTTVAVSVYISEVTSPEIRGRMVTIMQVFGAVGIVVVDLLGAMVSVPWLAVAGIVGSLTFLLLMLPMPETPRWLIKQGDLDTAKKTALSLKIDISFTGSTSCNGDGTESPGSESPSQQPVEAATDQDLSVSHYIKPLLIVFTLMSFQQLLGVNAVVFYTETIFRQAGLGHEVAKYSSTLIGLALFVGCLLASFVTDRVGRRGILMIASSITTVSLAILGTVFYMYNVNHVTNIGWLAVVSLVIYCMAYNFAWSTVPWIMLPELIPIHILGFAGSLGAVMNWLSSFLVTRLFPVMAASSIGEYGAFWVLCGVNLLSLLFVIVCVPETSGLSLYKVHTINVDLAKGDEDSVIDLKVPINTLSV